MEKTNIEDEYTRLKEKFLRLEKANLHLTQKLEKSQCKTVKLQKEIKKKSVPKILLSVEQEQLLSNRSKDINILNLL